MDAHDVLCEQRGPVFDPGSVHVEYTVEIVALGQVLRFSPSGPYHQCTIPILILTLLIRPALDRLDRVDAIGPRACWGFAH
jgi:hypothetical protein